jgi:hypothetical protein
LNTLLKLKLKVVVKNLSLGSQNFEQLLYLCL